MEHGCQTSWQSASTCPNLYAHMQENSRIINFLCFIPHNKMRVYSTQSKIAWDNAVKLSSSQIDIVVNRKACHQVVVNASIGRTFSGLTAKTLPLTVSVRASCPGMRRVHLKNQHPGMPHALVYNLISRGFYKLHKNGRNVGSRERCML